MQRYLPIGICAAFLMANAVHAQTETTKVAPSKGWLNDLNTAKAQSLKTGKPLMVVFRCDP